MSSQKKRKKMTFPHFFPQNFLFFSFLSISCFLAFQEFENRKIEKRNFNEISLKSKSGSGQSSSKSGQDESSTSKSGQNETSCCKSGQESESNECCKAEASKKHFKIVYSSQTGTSKKLAYELVSLVGSGDVIKVQDYEWDDLSKDTSVVVLILSTYDQGGPAEDST